MLVENFFFFANLYTTLIYSSELVVKSLGGWSKV